VTGLYDAVSVALVLSLFASVPASIVYLALSAARSRQLAANGMHDQGVRLEAMWGMALALPALLVVASGALEPGDSSRWWPPLIAVVFGLYAVPVLALGGRHLPAVARWYPATVAFVATPALMVAYAAAPDFESFPFFIFVAGVSRLGIGYVADCVVGVRFARAVGRRQAGGIAAAHESDEAQKADAAT